MRTQGMGTKLCVLLLSGIVLTSGAARAQNTGSLPQGLPLPPAIEKELAAKASDVTEVTLGKNMLDFASKFMKGNDPDQAQARKLIQGLQGIYVREYEFDKEGQYSLEQLQQLRSYFDTREWQPIVRERERKSGETTDIMVKTVNGETQGMFILSAEPKELSLVLILGPIRMDQLGELSSLGALHGLADIGASGKTKEKARDKNKDGGTQ